jgi:hypothetical protein
MSPSEVHKLIEDIGNELALVRFYHRPNRTYLVEISKFFCSSDPKIINLYWIEKETLNSWACSLSRVECSEIESIERSGISVDLVKVSHEDPEVMFSNPDICPYG